MKCWTGYSLQDFRGDPGLDRDANEVEKQHRTGLSLFPPRGLNSRKQTERKHKRQAVPLLSPPSPSISAHIGFKMRGRTAPPAGETKTVHRIFAEKLQINVIKS